jgi:ATP-dependent DNA ligase
VGPQWLHEIKHDGYRLIVRKQDGRVRLFTRRGFDWTDRYPVIRDAAARLRARSVTIDGEAVYCDGTGLAIFEKLHSRVYDDRVFLYAFDLLELDGVDYRSQELWARKIRLERLLAKVRGGIAFNEHLTGDGATRLQVGLRGYRLKASGMALPIGSVQRLDQGEESSEPSDAAA